MSEPTIRVVLWCVHVSNDGEETYELAFEDADGRTGTELIVGPDRSMRIATDEDDQ